MKTVSLVLAVISLVLALALAAVAYDMNGRLAHLAANEGSSRSAAAGDLAKMQTANDKINEAVKGLQQNIAQLSADSKQNATALDDMKKRINRLIDVIK